MFKVNNSVSIVNFEHEIAGWDSTSIFTLPGAKGEKKV